MGAITGVTSFKTQAGMLSGPVALCGLISDRSLRTPGVVIIISGIDESGEIDSRF